MRVIVFFLGGVVSMIMCTCCVADNAFVVIKTSKGDIRVELYADKAPLTVASFLGHVDAGDYSDAIFHRTVAGFMIQTGGYHEDMTEVEEGDIVRNEADNGLLNVKGTLAMARMDEIDSARMQFFINASDNSHLDHSDDSCTRQDETIRAKAAARGLYKPKTCKSFGYAVFGAVTSGMDVVEEIELADTGLRAGHQDVPLESIFITSIKRVESTELKIKDDQDQ